MRSLWTSLALVLAALALASAQEMMSCSEDGDKYSLSAGKDELKCGKDITFPNFKLGEDTEGPAVMAVNADSIDAVDQSNCNMYYWTIGGYKSVRTGDVEAGLVYVPEDKPSKAYFNGPLNDSHKKFGTVVMNGCSLVIQRVGNDFYVSHPSNGFSVKDEFKNGDKDRLGKRATVTPIAKEVSEGAYGATKLMRMSHVWGQWDSNKLEVYVGQLKGTLEQVMKEMSDAKVVNPEAHIRAANSPTYEKIEAAVTNKWLPSKDNIYDNCFKIVFSAGKLGEEDTAPVTKAAQLLKLRQKQKQKQKQKPKQDTKVLEASSTKKDEQVSKKPQTKKKGFFSSWFS